MAAAVETGRPVRELPAAVQSLGRPFRRFELQNPFGFGGRDYNCQLLVDAKEDERIKKRVEEMRIPAWKWSERDGKSVQIQVIPWVDRYSVAEEPGVYTGPGLDNPDVCDWYDGVSEIFPGRQKY